MKKQACAGCKFFLNTGANKAEEPVGLCRFDPPKQFFNAESGLNSSIQTPVHGHGWCGKFSAQSRGKNG